VLAIIAVNILKLQIMRQNKKRASTPEMLHYAHILLVLTGKFQNYISLLIVNNILLDEKKKTFYEHSL
jgi:hypothetical protein